VTGDTGLTGATGPTGIGLTGPTGPTGASGTGGNVATFFSTADVHNGECIGNSTFATNKHGACPAVVAANTYSADVQFLEGPVPAGGGTVSNLEATTDTAMTGSQSWTIDVIDNTAPTAVVLLSCTINATTSLSTTTCQNTGSAAVAAGHYLEVKATKGGSPLPADKPFRVTFRY
jgi:hypothetical protein